MNCMMIDDGEYSCRFIPNSGNEAILNKPSNKFHIEICTSKSPMACCFPSASHAALLQARIIHDLKRITLACFDTAQLRHLLTYVLTGRDFHGDEEMHHTYDIQTGLTWRLSNSEA